MVLWTQRRGICLPYYLDDWLVIAELNCRALQSPLLPLSGPGDCYQLREIRP